MNGLGDLGGKESCLFYLWLDTDKTWKELSYDGLWWCFTSMTEKGLIQPWNDVMLSQDPLVLRSSRDHLARKFTRRSDHVSGTAVKAEIERNLKALALSRCFSVKNASSGQFRDGGSFFLSFATHWNTGYLPWDLKHIQVRRSMICLLLAVAC